MILGIVVLLLLSIGAIQAADTNNTDSALCVIDGDSVEMPVASTYDDQVITSADSDPVDDNLVGSSVSNNKLKANTETTAVKTASSTKTFTDLANEIKNTESGSTLVLKGTYKYDSNKDKQYKGGIIIAKNINIVGKEKCVLDGSGKASIFRISSNYKVTLTTITFKNAYSKINGGAVCVSKSSSLTVKKCIFKNNKAFRANGGAIATGIKTTLKVFDSKFHSNKAVRDSSKKWPNDKRGMAGAIFVHMGSKFVLHNSELKYNTAYLTVVLVLSYDGSTVKTSTAHVQNCLFEKNSVTMNGVFYLDEYGRGTFLKSTFKNNVAKKEGGTLILDASKSALVKNCRFMYNKGYVGAAIDLYKFNNVISHAKIVGCTFFKNSAKESGGAIYSNDGSMKLVNCKFTANKAGTSGGAIWTSGSLKLTSPVFKKNKAKWGGAILVKNKKVIYCKKGKFIKNIATKNGKNVFGLADGGRVIKVSVR